MKTFIYFLAIIGCFSYCATAQIVVSPAHKVELQDLQFKSIFATNKKDSLKTYCLLGKNIFRAKHSANTDALITEWIAKHPKAQVVPVATYEPLTPDHKGIKQSYCWLVDNGDTINTYLIRKGCFIGGTMCRPNAGNERNETEKEMYGDIAVHIPRQGYKDFLGQIRSAENRAKKERLGIWKKQGNPYATQAKRTKI